MDGQMQIHKYIGYRLIDIDRQMDEQIDEQKDGWIDAAT